MVNITEIAEKYRHELKGTYENREIENILSVAIEHATGLSKLQLSLTKNTLSNKQKNQILAILPQLKAGKPIQYILGEAWFYDLKLKVNSAVLIPRPETEELVALTIKTAKEIKAKNILDIGTGSGCIALAIKRQLPSIAVDALDKSIEALAVAKDNAQKNNLSINFINVDILNKDKWTDKKYNIIVSNPPYIPNKDKKEMSDSVLHHEPHLALFVPNEDALIFYKYIGEFALKNLNTGGRLLFEIHENKALQVKNLLEGLGLKHIEIVEDLQGKERFVICNY